MATTDAYWAALAAADKVGSANADDAGVMAQFCARVLQTMVGAVSPALVWNGAQARGLTANDLLALSYTDPVAVANLMWVD